MQLIQSSPVTNPGVVCFWPNISPTGSGTAKLPWKESLLALHCHERGLYHLLSLFGYIWSDTYGNNFVKMSKQYVVQDVISLIMGGNEGKMGMTRS